MTRKGKATMRRRCATARPCDLAADMAAARRGDLDDARPAAAREDAPAWPEQIDLEDYLAAEAGR